MYHIGICDDDPVFIEYIKRLICMENTLVEFYEYLSGKELIQDMQKRERYDLLILDVAKVFRRVLFWTILSFF